MARVARLAVVVLLVVGWIFTLRPATLGGPLSVVVVSGNSMLPDLTPGELVVSYRRGSYDVGDVIVYRVPEDELGAGTRVIHRVIGGSAREGFRTRGDNRRTPDRWRPRPDDIEGVKLAALPDAGRAMMLLASPTSLGVLVALMVFVSVDGRPGVPRGRRRRRRPVRVERSGPVVAMWPPVAPAPAPAAEPDAAVAVEALEPADVPPRVPFPKPAVALLPAPAPVALLPAPAPVALLPAPAPVVREAEPAAAPAPDAAPAPAPPVTVRRRPRSPRRLFEAARGALGSRAHAPARVPVADPPAQPTPPPPAPEPTPTPAAPAPAPLRALLPGPAPALALPAGPAPVPALLPGPAPALALLPGPAPALALMPGPAHAPRAATPPPFARRRRRSPAPLGLIAVAGGVVGGVLASRRPRPPARRR